MKNEVQAGTIMDNIKIPVWISTNVLNFETEASRAYISNISDRKLYWLKGKSSDLWNVIINSQNIKSISDYAKKENLENELDDFLNELEQAGLIIIKNSYKPQETNSSNSNEIEIENFLIKWTQKCIDEKKLESMLFELTYKCNENCLHCYCEKTFPNTQIRFNDIKTVIDDAYELGVRQIVLTGGECTLADDFVPIAKYIREKRIGLTIFTNGQKLYDNPDLFNEVVNLYPSVVGLSLYSINPEIHDKITGIKGSCIKTMKVIEKLLSHNIPVEIKCFITKHNEQYYKEVINYAKKNKCQITVDSTLVPNNSGSNICNYVSDKHLEEFFKYYFENKLTNAGDGELINEDFLLDIPCNAGHVSLTITPELNVTSCPGGDINWGNIKKYSLKKLWEENSPDNSLKYWRDLKRKDFKECFKEDYCAYCNFCPKRVGNKLSKQMLCERAKIKMNAAKSYAVS